MEINNGLMNEKENVKNLNQCETMESERRRAREGQRIGANRAENTFSNV